MINTWDASDWMILHQSRWISLLAILNNESSSCRSTCFISHHLIELEQLWSLESYSCISDLTWVLTLTLLAWLIFLTEKVWSAYLEWFRPTFDAHVDDQGQIKPFEPSKYGPRHQFWTCSKPLFITVHSQGSETDTIVWKCWLICCTSMQSVHHQAVSWT